MTIAEKGKAKPKKVKKIVIPEEAPNFFDALETGHDPAEALRAIEAAKKESDKLNYLIHRVFEQTPSGKELLERWRTALLMQPTAEAEMDLIEIGIREGQKRFIRAIILTVNQVEKGE